MRELNGALRACCHANAAALANCFDYLGLVHTPHAYFLDCSKWAAHNALFAVHATQNIDIRYLRIALKLFMRKEVKHLGSGCRTLGYRSGNILGPLAASGQKNAGRIGFHRLQLDRKSVV